MSFEETVAMVFQPGFFEVFCLASSFVFMAQFLGGVLIVFFDFLLGLIRRYIWPGQKPTPEKEAP